ncbi:MAG TPA: hypothetical protein VM912_04325 [Terriglobales bacterium]|nr:hypothetical protein [Terriglobales bacterium]
MRKILFLCSLTSAFLLPIVGFGYKVSTASPSGATGENSRKGIDDFNRRFIAACRSLDHKAQPSCGPRMEWICFPEWNQ